METIDNFPRWLQRELNKRGWDQAELARRGDITAAHISRIVSGLRQPGPDFCKGVARALRVPPERVFRLAGLLPPRIIGAQNEEQKHELLDYFDALDPDTRHTIVTLTRALYEQRADYNANSKPKEEK